MNSTFDNATGTPHYETTLAYLNNTIKGPTDTQKILIDVSQKLTMVTVVIIMFGLGCSVDFKKMIQFAKSPKQFGTGISLQLLLMPVWGYTVTRALRMTLPESLGVIFQSVAPGGTYSNLVTYWLDGDMDLSVMMTSASTLLALGTMPLWLLIFSTLLQLDENLRVPFASLGIALATVSAPVITGMVVRHFLPKISRKLTKICTITGSLMIPGLFILLGLSGGFNYPLSYRTYVAVFVMSSIAVIVGYSATRFPCLNFTIPCRRTVAIETAYQSTPVAFSVVVLSFSPANPEIFGPMAFYPILYGLVQISSSFVIIFIYKVLKATGVKWVLPYDPEHEKQISEDDSSKSDDVKHADDPEKLLSVAGDEEKEEIES